MNQHRRTRSRTLLAVLPVLFLAACSTAPAPRHPPDALVSLLKRTPARAFQAVNESCLMVTPNSGKAAAKPGCPIGGARSPKRSPRRRDRRES